MPTDPNTSAPTSISNPLDPDQDSNSDSGIWTPLQIASSQGNLPQVKALLSPSSPSTEPADPNASPTGYYGQTALQAPAANGHLDVLQTLLSHGAEVDAPGGNNGGRTALALAAGRGEGKAKGEDNLEIENCLISAGAEINRPAHRYMGRTALQAAAEGGNIPIVKRLLSLGAEVNAPPAHNNGRTALQAASGRRRREKGCEIILVELLLDAGAEVNGPSVGIRGYRRYRPQREPGMVIS